MVFLFLSTAIICKTVSRNRTEEKIASTIPPSPNFQIGDKIITTRYIGPSNEIRNIGEIIQVAWIPPINEFDKGKFVYDVRFYNTELKGFVICKFEEDDLHKFIPDPK